MPGCHLKTTHFRPPNLSLHSTLLGALAPPSCACPAAIRTTQRGGEEDSDDEAGGRRRRRVGQNGVCCWPAVHRTPAHLQSVPAASWLLAYCLGCTALLPAADRLSSLRACVTLPAACPLTGPQHTPITALPLCPFPAPQRPPSPSGDPLEAARGGLRRGRSAASIKE